MIRKASALAPDDASITDSLGWALYKRGRCAEAIETLAARPPPEIRSRPRSTSISAMRCSPPGGGIEARFAWRAALVTAEDEDKPRIEAKLERGLTPATAAP